jgi:prepilin-type N-terminal cleavage/methylation domain-containing protein
MKTQLPNRRRRVHAQRGMTLIEVMVAVLVFTIVFLAALGLYQAANRAYLATDAATIQQQNARYAMDRVSETLRDAGANYNPLGRTSIPDEQIEGAWEAAVLVRGDFNRTNETDLEGTYPLITTGNRDIVGYVLRKAAGPNSVNLDVKMDLTPTTNRDAARSGTTITGEETRQIAVAAATLAQQTNPPYQLVRVTFDTTTGNPIYEVIADNVFRMSFIYRNAAGTEVVTAASNSGGDDDERGVRATIRRVGINIVTMAERADFGYTDANNWTADAFSHVAPSQTDVTRNRRKFNLSEEIVAVNLGRKGARQNTAPNVNIAAPAWIKVCTGHCRSFLIQWAATTTPGIATYKLRIQASAPFVDQYVPVPTTQYYFTQTDPTVQNYSFSVAGMTTTGLIGAYSPVVVKAATHAGPPTDPSGPSIPRVPENVQGTQATGVNAMAVTWNRVEFNTGTISTQTCTQAGTSPGPSAPPNPWNVEAVDLSHHTIHRGLFAAGYAVADGGVLNGDFTSATTNRVDNAPALGDLVNVTPRNNTFTDNTAAPCGQYYYRVRAFDGCDAVVAGNGSTAMGQTAKYIPAAGVTPARPAPPTPAAAPVVVGGNYTMTFTWPPVVRDSTGAKAATAHYKVVRERSTNAGVSWDNQTLLPVWEKTTITDTVPATIGTSPAQYRYAIRAVYQCGVLGNTDRENTGDWYTITCQPPTGNTMSISMPPNGTTVVRPAETGFTPRLAASGADWTAAELTIRRPDGTAIATETITGSPAGSPTGYTFSPFTVASLSPGVYQFTFIGHAGSCRSVPMTSSVTVTDGTCGATITEAAWANNSGSSAFQQLNFKVVNDCDFAGMTINGLDLAWSNVTPSSRYVTTIRYGGTAYASSLDASSGAETTAISFGTNNVNLAGNATSLLFEIVFNDNMTVSGAHNNNDPGQIDSIRVNLTAPTAGTDEIVPAPPVP